MGYSNGKITAAVNSDDVSTVLGVNSHDWGTLCSSNKINPAAKCKPIKYNKPESLTDSERLGAPADKLNGIYYGVKMVAPQYFTLLHLANYEYQRIDPLTDYSRIDDFIGYDHNAVFNPRGLVDIKATKEMGCRVLINYNTNPSGTGIDVAEFLTQYTTNTAFRLANCYPCALVTLTKNGTTKHYVRALWGKGTLPTSSTDVSGFVQMCTSGAWRYQWTMLINDIPNIAAGDSLRVTIFFMRYINHANYTGSNNYQKWVEIENTLLNSSQVCVTCPDAVSRTVSVETLHPKAAKVTGVIMKNREVGITMQWFTDEANKPTTVGKNYTFTVYLTPVNGGETAIYGCTVAVPSTIGTLAETHYVDSEIMAGIAEQKFHVDWTVSETDGNILVNQGTVSDATLPKA